MTSNVWRRFQQLIQQPRLSVVTVQSINGDGTSTVETPSGSTLVVDGESVAAGNKAFVRDGRIQGPAPDLPVYEEAV